MKVTMVLIIIMWNLSHMNVSSFYFQQITGNKVYLKPQGLINLVNVFE